MKIFHPGNHKFATLHMPAKLPDSGSSAGLFYVAAVDSLDEFFPIWCLYLSKCFHLNFLSDFFFTLCILQTHSVIKNPIGRPVAKSLEVPNWHWLISSPMGALEYKHMSLNGGECYAGLCM